jgi:transcriptional antiterminator RfaH
MEEGELRLKGIQNGPSENPVLGAALEPVLGCEVPNGRHASSTGITVEDESMIAHTARSAARVTLGNPEDWIARGSGRWWVLHTHARNEKRVAHALAERRIRHYLPLVSVHHTYAKAKVTFRVPLFPGYVFLCGDHGDCDMARRTDRIARVLHVEDQAGLRAELWHIYRVVEGGKAVELFPALQAGQRCRITRGALQGVEGVVVRHAGRCRMYLNVSTLGQSAAVEVDAALLEPVG